MHTVDLSDLRCVTCNADIAPRSDGEGFHCTGCGREYERVLGVPFLGAYEGEDLLGLIEIAANIVNRGRFGVTPQFVAEWQDLLGQYDRSDDKDAFLATLDPRKRPHFMNRYGEWQEVNHLASGLSLSGLRVLDVGAGLGFDSYGLSLRGAQVTALELSPLLAEAGAQNFRDIRWIGGLSHCLPFKNASFDAVFCNAALHHMRDIPTAIAEALRVLRPGGYLITTCDSFRPSHSADDAELEIFDRDPAVLLGVNEGVPRFSDFISTLDRHASIVDVELFTHILYGQSPEETVTALTPWNLAEDGGMLAGKSGSLALKVRLTAPWPEAAPSQTTGILTADEYVAWTTSAANAVSRLAPMMPDHYVDLPFPGTGGSKFELLNGWRRPRKYHQSRTAYHRGRWFLRRQADAAALRFELALPTHGASRVETIDILLNGVAVDDFALGAAGSGSVAIDVSSIPAGHVFSLELQQRGGGTALEEAEFVVRNRRFITAGEHGDERAADQIANSTVYVVIPVFNRLQFTRACIGFLKAQTYQPIRIIVADGGSTDGTQVAIRSEFPDVDLVTSDAVLWWSGSMALGIDHALRQSGRDDFLLMMNNDTELAANYVAGLVEASRTHDAAVGALIVDSRDPQHVLDAGEYLDWASYTFSVKNVVAPGEIFCDDVDVLPGRGTLVPLHMIRTAGNVDARTLPHYLADYEFFYRLKRHGFQLGVSYETEIRAHIEETGIIPTRGRSSFQAMWREAFSRRSMSNVVDHWQFVSRHAPPEHRNRVRLRLIKRVVADLTLRTPARILFYPLYLLLTAPWRIRALIRGQRRTFGRFFEDMRTNGTDVFCRPEDFPGLIRIPLYLTIAPGPVGNGDVEACGLGLCDLLERRILRVSAKADLYCFARLDFDTEQDVRQLKRLLRRSRNPIAKLNAPIALRNKSREAD